MYNKSSPGLAGTTFGYFDMSSHLARVVLFQGEAMPPLTPGETLHPIDACEDGLHDRRSALKSR